MSGFVEATMPLQIRRVTGIVSIKRTIHVQVVGLRVALAEFPRGLQGVAQSVAQTKHTRQARPAIRAFGSWCLCWRRWVERWFLKLENLLVACYDLLEFLVGDLPLA